MFSASSEAKSEAARLAAHQRRHGTESERQRLADQKYDWKFLTPLIWAPTFPIIRMSSARLPPTSRNILIGAAILVANLHGFWLINNRDLKPAPFRASLRWNTFWPLSSIRSSHMLAADLSDEALGITR